MKAIRKADGKEVDVVLLRPREYISTELDADYGIFAGKAIYRAEDLVIDEPIDWSSFRREAAKDAMSGMMGNADFWQHVWSNSRISGKCDYPSEIAHFAIACADELIRQLKEK